MQETISSYAIACYNWKILKSSFGSEFLIYTEQQDFNTQFVNGKVINKNTPIGLWSLKNEFNELVEETIFIR